MMMMMMILVCVYVCYVYTYIGILVASCAAGVEAPSPRPSSSYKTNHTAHPVLMLSTAVTVIILRSLRVVTAAGPVVRLCVEGVRG